jgi:hypothetical protein
MPGVAATGYLDSDCSNAITSVRLVRMTVSRQHMLSRSRVIPSIVMENSPSGRMHVEVTLKKIIYDAFVK